MSSSDGLDGSARAGSTGAWGVAAFTAGWALLCVFAVAPASWLVVGLASAAGRPALATGIALPALVESLVYLVLSFLVFRVSGALGLPAWRWVLGPAGYVASVVVYVAVMRLLASTDASPSGVGWTFIIADTAVTALGAWTSTRPSSPPPAAPLEAGGASAGGERA